MKHLHKMILAVAVFSLFGAPARAVSSPIQLVNFQVAGIAGYSGTATSYFGQASWTPYIGLGPIGVRGEVGITSFDFGGGRFIATNFEALFHLNLFPGFALEAGGGMHIWHGQAQAVPAYTANLVLGSPFGVDRLFAGYTRYTGGTGTNELRVGIGFEL